MSTIEQLLSPAFNLFARPRDDGTERNLTVDHSRSRTLSSIGSSFVNPTISVEDATSLFSKRVENDFWIVNTKIW